MDTDIDKALARLGYDREWISSGIISEQFLLAQYAEIQMSDDDNAEHYRCGAYRNYIQSKQALSDDEIDNIFALTDCGPDGEDLRLNRVIELVRSGLLTAEQFGELGNRSEVHQPPVDKVYARHEILRAIDERGLAETFERIKQTQDSWVHERVLEHPDLVSEQVVWLAQNGANKRIRNVAKQLSKSRRFR
ncbi:MAG: hypothetical protein QGH60_00930 [Phycisphaerae bacterium]|jgi:hypothetical protein|nr:hypothetical protein [Phycisphaerae bacterium]